MNIWFLTILNYALTLQILVKLFETLDSENERYYAKDPRDKVVAIVIMLVPDPFNGFHDMKHNSAISCQSQLEFSK